MGRLKTWFAGTSSEHARLEEVLRQCGTLELVQFVELNMLPERFPNWASYDLVCVTYDPLRSSELLAYLAVLLGQGLPPVFFFVKDFTPENVLRLMNSGAWRVLPLDELEQTLPACINAVFGAGSSPALGPFAGVNLAPPEEPKRGDDDIRRLNDELERLVLARTGALEAANRELAAEIGRRKAVEEITDQLEQILWQTPDFVCICAPDGALRYINKAGRTMFRIGDRQPVGEMNLFEAFTPFHRRKFRDEILPYVLKNGSWRGETQLQLADGKIIPVTQVIIANREHNEDVLGFASIAHDISEFKRIEQELNDSREDYRTLAEAAHDYIFVMDSEGMMAYANRYACQALSLDPGRVAGMPAARFFPESFSSELLQMTSEVREIDSPVYMEGSFWQGEREYWLGTWLVPVHNSLGRLVSILGIARDISEQRKTDEALRRALENEKQINQMRSSFFSMTSHQFRTPLSTILLSVELLQKYGPRLDDAKRFEQYNRIHEAGDRLHALLENILVISRVESGQLRLLPKDFDLVELCERVLQELRTNDREAHTLNFLHADDLIMVHSDSEMIERVLENLVSNALKYSPKDSPVHVSLKREGQVVILEVKDQGIGIPETDQKRLFQPFQRASNTEGIQGTGIGLTIVKKSVDLLNGHVFMRSKEGQGTTFIIRFPVNLEDDRSLDRLGVV